jgi:predicted metal-dependent phosphoesterase TrpH
MPIELHCHSTASDGDCTPSELVERALAIGITTLALTDHDTVDGVSEALEAAKEHSLRVIPAVELSCHFEENEVHLLGYFIEHRDPDFLSLLEQMREERRERVRTILAKLADLGIELSFEDVEVEATGHALGRPHVARALVTGGHSETVSQAFDTYIGNNGPAYVGRSLLSLEDGIEAIRKAGGVSVIAHPGSYRDWPRVERMMNLPVNGVEVWHPAHRKADLKRAKRLGGRYNKVLTGGSDFHGPRGDYHEMGSARVTERVVTRLQEVVSERTHLALQMVRLDAQSTGIK